MSMSTSTSRSRNVFISHSIISSRATATAGCSQKVTDSDLEVEAVGSWEMQVEEKETGCMRTIKEPVVKQGSRELGQVMVCGTADHTRACARTTEREREEGEKGGDGDRGRERRGRSKKPGLHANASHRHHYVFPQLPNSMMPH